MAKKLTDALVAKLATPKGGPKIVWDTLATGFGLKTTPAGRRLFVLQTKYPGHAVQTIRTIGAYPGMSLADARRVAVEWYGLARRGVDPKVEEEKAKVARERQAMLAEKRSFGAVAEAFFAEGLAGQRRGARVALQITNELVPHWGTRPIHEITDLDVIDLIKKIKARATKGAYARNIFESARAVFEWAIAERRFGIATSPCDRLKPSKLCGKKEPRTRDLTDDEVKRLWAACNTVGYPYGAIVKVLLLTGCRVSEVSGAQWPEFDFRDRLWTIPATRFKSNRPHVVPIDDDLQALLETLPRRGDFLFVANGRNKPVNSFSKVKLVLDELAGVSGWVLHDCRRTLRTGLSKLRIADEVKEAVLGHAKRGLKKNYDVYDYLDEKREALALWAARLCSIVEPAPVTPRAANVVPIGQGRSARQG
jgi:integrase